MTQAMEAVQQDVEPQVLSDRSQTTIARLYEEATPADLFVARPVVDYPIDATFNDEIRLLGYSIGDQNLQPGTVTFVSLFWQPLTPPREDYEVFVQFWTDDETSIGGAHDFPFGGMYRTRIWQPDEVVVTHHWIVVPDDLAVGRYTLVAGLYRLLYNERLPVAGRSADPQQRIARAADLRYPPPTPIISGQPPEPAIRFGDTFSLDSLKISINGHAQVGQTWQASPSDTIDLDLFWDTLKRPEQDYSVFLHLSAQDDLPPLAQGDSTMGGGSWPTGAWRPGDITQDHLSLTLPDDLPAGTYDVLAGVYFWQTGERLPAYEGQSETAADRIRLGQIIVAGG